MHQADLPLTGRNGGDKKEEHKKKEHRGTDESTAADGYRGPTVNGRTQEPQQRKPFTTRGKDTRYPSLARTSPFPFDLQHVRPQDLTVKYVAASSAGDEHVRPALPCYNATGDQVRDRCPHCQNSQSYDRIWDAEGFTHLDAAKK